jgi:hypothetical protein
MKISRSAARIGQLLGYTPGRLAAVHGLALAGLVGIAASWAPMAQAVPVLSSASNIVVPATTSGIYINVVSGVYSASPSSATGWDINPWGSSSLYIYDATGGGNVSSANSSVASLAVGTVVGSGSSFSSTAPAAVTFGALAGQWTLNATNYFGFKFIGDDTLLHYGYASVNVGSTALVRTVGQIWYESAAATAITVSAVPEPSAAAMLLAGLTVGVGVLRRRREPGR